MYEYERLCNHTNRKQWILVVFGGVRLCSFQLCSLFSCTCCSVADFRGVKNPCYSVELKAQALSLFNVTQQELVLSNDKFPSHPLYVRCINEQHMDEEM